MRESHVILSALTLALLSASPCEANILKGLKNAAKGKLKEKTEQLKTQGKEMLNSTVNGAASRVLGGDATNGTNSQSNNGMGRSVGDARSNNTTSGTNYIGTENDKVDNARLQYVPDAEELDAPEGLQTVHASTLGADFTNVRGCFYSPKQTASTVHLTVDDTPYFSDFYDGVAYVSVNGNHFYINTRGEKLFDSYVKESDVKTMPRFCNGHTIEQQSVGGKKKVVIRDKSGNTVNTIEALASSPYFVDGIAAIVTGKTEYVGPFTLQYINTDGDVIFENLALNLTSSITAKSDLAKILREESEGLTAVPAIDAQTNKILWGFRNGSGSIVIKPKYFYVSDFKDGMAMFFEPEGGYRDGKWGFIDKSGREVIPATFTKRPSDFNSGYARVEARDGAIYLIDKSGNKKKGPYGRDAKEGDIDYITPFVDGRAIIGLSYPGMGATKYVLIDPNFRKLGWGRIPMPNISNEENPLFMSDGKMFYNGENSTSRHFYWINPSNMDLINGNVLCNPYVNGYSRFDYQGEHGYVDENYNYVIKFEKNEF